MFENFPYTDMHQLNLDWIIKIAKDFLDQYTSLQQMITDGETSLTNLTNDGLAALQEKADTLEAALDNWYETHSEDIADKLADALADLNAWYTQHSEDIAGELASALQTLNTWYTQHQNYLDQTLTEKTAAFNTAADAKAAETIASIPDDYTTLATSIDAIRNVVSDSDVSLTFSDQSGYYDTDGTLTPFNNISGANVSVNAGDSYVISFWSFYDMAPILFYDSNDNFLSAIHTGRTPAYNRLIYFTVPANASKMLIQTLKYCTGQIILKAVTKTNNSNVDARNVTYKNLSAKYILDNNTKNLFEEMNVTLSEQDGFYNYSNGGFASYPPAGSTAEKIYGTRIEVMPGETYLVSGYSYYAMGMAVLFSGQGNFLGGWSGDDDHHYFKNIEVQIPDNETVPAYIIVQSWKPDLPYFKIQKLAGVTAKTSILYGKKVTVIGDSITELNNLATSKNWNQYMEDWTKCIVQNLGMGGTGFTHPQRPYINRISSIQEEPDIIGIACSFNDLDSRQLPIGNVDDTGTSTIAGYVNDFFSALMEAYPTTPIICYSQGPWAVAKPGDQRPDDYISIVKQICRLKGVPFNDDLYNGCVLHPWIENNQEVYYKHDNPFFPNDYGNLDSVHPNSEGHKVIARYLYPMFEKNIVSTGLSY